jgi:phage host-nuclease inhibitor protein Gam
MDEKTGQDLQEELKRLEYELHDREAALPAHSVRPSQVMEIEELENRIREIKEELKKQPG